MNPSKKALRAFLILLPILFFFSSIIIRHLLHPSLYVNLDVSEGFYTARQMLAGKSLYIDWKVLNPPSIYVLYFACAKLAQFLPLSPLLVFYSFVGVLALIGCGLIQRSDHSKSEYLALAYSFFVIAVSISGYTDFAEREYLFMIVLIPYMILRSASPSMSPLKAALLFFTGYCALFKPQFLLFLICLETYFYVQKNPLKKGPFFAVLSGAFAPYIALAFFDPESLKAFLQTFPSLYWYYDIGDAASSLSSFFKKIALHVPVLVLSLGIFLFQMKRFRILNKDLSSLFLITLLCSLVSLVSQNRYWSYHGIPLFATCIVFWIYFLLTTMKGKKEFKISFSIFALFALICYHHLFTIPSKPRYGEFTSRFSRLISPGETILPISYSCKLVGSHYYSGLEFSGHWLHYFTLNGLYKERNHNQFALEKLERIKKELIHTIKTEQPKIILVDTEKRGTATPLREILYDYMKIFPVKGYFLIPSKETSKPYPKKGSFDVWIRDEKSLAKADVRNGVGSRTE